ncbi:aminobenzoyl-glutamate transport protein [Kineosphaera limosa]|uniref:Putative transporter n=1 Tax=Kineosphaera limosa NBRC 100340 TaxID=1184609 RepID=K6WL41_9MICO|nr:AbgT family transporter [Kineosphaera limosa]NYE03189.1 aminobenzoyl-glutamate transport protein [Kineosphaera limosa]GAB94526.1 putative transporter [Kineosphaera limosa NBRC 100340]
MSDQQVSEKESPPQTRKRGFVQRSLDWIEKAGNALPHPVSLFAILAVLVLIVSAVMSASGVTVQSPVVGEGEIGVKNLLDAEGIEYLFTTLVANFIGFAPLGVVLATMIGIGIAEHTGLISAALRGFVLAVPRTLITFGIVFAAIMSSVASDAGYVVLPPLAAMIYAAMGRHPLAGLATAFAGVSAGFSANLLLSGTDVLLGELTIQAAQTIDPAYAEQMNLAMNYYFIIASTFFLAIVGTVVGQYYVEPRLGPYHGPSLVSGAAPEAAAETEQVPRGTSTSTKSADDAAEIADAAGDADGAGKADPAESSEEAEVQSLALTPLEKKGMLWAGISLALTCVAIALLVVPQNAPLRADDGGIVQSPFMSSLVVIIIIAFFVPGLVYGIVVGKIKKDDDAVDMMTKTMSAMALFVVLAFTAGQFIAWFNESNLATFMAVYGAEFLEGINLTGFPLVLMFILIVAFINLFIGSASAKWAILAPVFVPIMMQLGYSPELTQMAYRVADSGTNVISPLLPYFALIIAFAQRYDKGLRIGSLIAVMLPFSIAYLVSWTVMLVLWMLAGIPLGPNAPILYQP